MQKPTAKLIMMIYLGFILSACNTMKPLGSGPFKVQIPWAERGQDYSIQQVEIHTLKDVVRMEGDAATIRVNQQSDLRPPEAHFTQVSEGIVIPTDPLSAQLFAVYAHMERLLSLESELGIAQFIPRPRLVSIESKIISEDTRERILDNATFVGSLDLLAVMPISTNSLPITMNAGVLAHEQFHAIFYHLMLKDLTAADLRNMDLIKDEWGPEKKDYALELKTLRERPAAVETQTNAVDVVEVSQKQIEENRMYNNLFILQALNEGFADFWGWLYSGDSNFIVRSIPDVRTHREIKVQTRSLPTEEEIQRLLGKPNKEVYRSMAYFLGTSYATILRGIAEREGRFEAAQVLLASLKNIKNIWTKLDHKQKLSPQVIYEILFGTSGEMTVQRCCSILKSLHTNDIRTSITLKRCETVRDQCL
ncbi:MAG: hypothetical protein AB7F59_07990 [Bdellovibrionales bacterium]